MSGSAAITKTFWMIKTVLPFKAGDSKLTFIFIPKALANTGILSKITQGFSTLKEKCYLVPAFGLNLINKDLTPGSRREKKNGGDWSVRAQSQVRFTSCIYIRTLLLAAKNKSGPLTPRLPGHTRWGQRWKLYGRKSPSPLKYYQIWVRMVFTNPRSQPPV